MNQTPTSRDGARWDFMILGAMLIFGGYGLFIKLNPQISPLLFLFAFQVVGAIGFGFLSGARGLAFPPRGVRWLLATLAFVAVGNDYAYFWGLRLTSVANAAVAHQMVSVVLLFLAPRFLNQPTQRNEWRALAVSLLGVGVLYWDGISIGGTRDMWGISLGLLSAVFLACLFVLYRRLADLKIPLTTINAWRYGLSILLLLPLIVGEGITGLRNNDVVVLLVFGVLFALLASGIHNFAIGRARALHASIIGKSEPVVASIYAYFILRESPSAFTLLGGALIIGASLWLALQKKER